MSALKRLLPVVVVLTIVALVSFAINFPSWSWGPPREVGAAPVELLPVVAQVDTWFAKRWDDAGLSPAPSANDLQILRRLSLALHGSIPSLEEIREFESDTRSNRIDHWVARMLADTRFADYFAERLARSFVGKEDGQFIIFRRDRFVEWLAEHLKRGTRYDKIVRDMISATGLSTGKPAVNFVTAAFANDDIDENKLAGKTVRAFLGQRIDCAQCHDHPFDHWKQNEFEGLAAFFGQARHTIVGLEDKTEQDGKKIEYEVVDRKSLEQRMITPTAPFHPEWMPNKGTRREMLAAWITHPENRRFERAIANRIWGLLFGKAYIDPVDDLRDPPAEPDLLDILGSDFRTHGYDLRRLIQVITASRTFKLSSEWEPPSATSASVNPPAGETRQETGSAVLDESTIENQWLLAAEREWACFPLVRLRPEQVIGSILQSTSLQTIDQNSHLFTRLKKFGNENDFVREYGDLGENELQDRGGTIPQRLLLMNGNLAHEAVEANVLSSTRRINRFSTTDEQRIDSIYLICLTRRPQPEEAAWFLQGVSQAKSPEMRVKCIGDLVWSLLNSTEFSWNH